jgi:hypothetical protein
MSKSLGLFLPVFAASLQILQFHNSITAQDLDARISLYERPVVHAAVSGHFLDSTRPNTANLVLLNQFAGTFGLATRATSVRLADRRASPIAFKELVPGEYLAEGPITGWSYDLAMAPMGRASAGAHVSWIGSDRGILMLNDLLPQIAVSRPVAARVRIDPAEGWRLITVEREVEKGVYEIPNAANAVFVLAKAGSCREVRAADGDVRITIFGDWQFTDADAAESIDRIMLSYGGIFGGISAGDAVVTLMRFPVDVPVGNWEAETRGNNITILSSDMPFKTQSAQRLDEQLRHEIFHLWFPNGVRLTGNYDWFYEGFALYQSLKLGVNVNRLRFNDFLDSLARAYNADASRTGRLSLLEASRNRWSGDGTSVYARGMLVAFLCDLALLQRSKGRMSVEGLLREIYHDHRTASPIDGSEAVIKAMRSHPELVPIVDSYVTGTEIFDWTAQLAAAGIEPSGVNSPVTLRPVRKPDRQQRDLLDKLGYNNWRKLSEKPK